MRKFITSLFQKPTGGKPSPAKTEGYKPQFPRRWFMTPRDLPAFTFETIYSMMIDPQIRLCLAMRRAPLYGLQLAYQAGVDEQGKLKYEYGVQCRNPAVAAWIERQISTIWQTHLPAIASSQVWGWSGGEITVKLSDHNLVEIDRLLPRHAADVIMMKRGQKRSGITVKRVANVGEVELDFPYCWFHSFNPEAGEDYGNPILLGAYSPWCDKWLNGAALDTRKLYMHKDAYGGMKVGYPEEMIPVAGSNTPLPARDIALQIAEQRTAGGVITYPSTTDHQGKPKWIIEEATVASNPAHILQYPKDLDDEMRHGMEIPDDVISSDGAGGWAGKRVAMAAFYSGLDDWIVQIFHDFKPVIDGLMILNWGKCFDYNLSHKPLGAVAMEQQSGAGGFQSQPQQPQQSNQPDKGSFSFPFKMSAVGDWKSEETETIVGANI